MQQPTLVNKNNHETQERPEHRKPRDAAPTRSGIVVDEREGAIPARPHDEDHVGPRLWRRVTRDRFIRPHSHSHTFIEVFCRVGRDGGFEVVEVEVEVPRGGDSEHEVVGLRTVEVDVVELDSVTPV